jgi:glycosyltransferase involved in cell wall biosynthesis
MREVKERILYVIGAPLPTSKAYGVTTKETIKVLIENNYCVKVISDRGNYYDSEFSLIRSIQEFFPKNFLTSCLLFIGTKGKNIINVSCWRLGTILRTVASFRIVNKFNPDIIWVRDPYLAYLYLRKFDNIKLILEIHDKSGTFVYKKLNKYEPRIIFCPISESNYRVIASLMPKSKIILSPMSVGLNQIATKTDCLNHIKSLTLRNFENIKIGYVGRIAPSGYSKGVEELFLLAKYYARKKINASVTIIGAEKKEVESFYLLKMKYGLLGSSIDVLPHTNHSEALKRMKDFDILVLPLYKSNSYNGMPLKLLEYIASGRITIVANSAMYTNFFKNEFRPFIYEPFNTKSLADAINNAMHSPNLKSVLFKGLDLAHEYTWERRTLRILGS